MDNNRINVYVNEGKLIGIITENVYGDKYIAFRGIPYAKPPVGELRFKVLHSTFWMFNFNPDLTNSLFIILFYLFLSKHVTGK
jgi:hypothetical protein